jgi:hypothetical protein
LRNVTAARAADRPMTFGTVSGSADPFPADGAAEGIAAGVVEASVAAVACVHAESTMIMNTPAVARTCRLRNMGGGCRTRPPV